MRIEAYKEYLQKKNLPGDDINRQLAIIEDLHSFLTDLGVMESSAGKVEMDAFAKTLIIEGRNTLENFSALRDFFDWFGHRKLYVALLELLDCHNAIAVLANEVEARNGRKIRDQIFLEAVPPLGASEKERWTYTQEIMARMQQQIAPQKIRTAWFKVQHGIPADVWRRIDLANMEKYRDVGTIDNYLSLKRQERDTMLTRLRDENKLWYTVLIDDEVLDFIQSDPEMEVGRREGNAIYLTKVPYNATRYLHESDPRMKRYHACHCPLVREAILQDQPVSPDVCECSLGHASHYLTGLDLEIKGEVLESAIKGDARCRFVFHLPDNVR